MRYHVVFIGGGMNFSLKQEIGLATLLLFIIIAIHYFISVASDKYWKGLCDSWYCLELIPLGDVISISIAIIGLYFVVKSLDAWKHQDQYQTAKNNIIFLHDISKDLTNYISEIKNINEISLSLKDFMGWKENTYTYAKYIKIKNKNNIFEKTNNIENIIIHQNKNLYQDDFKNLVNNVLLILRNIDNKIKNQDKLVMKTQNEEVINFSDIKENPPIESKIFIKNFDLDKQSKNKTTFPDISNEFIEDLISTESINLLNFQLKLDALQQKLNNHVE